MSFIIQASRTAAAMRRLAMPAQVRCLTISRPQFLKETSGDHPNQGEAYEREKQTQIRHQKEGKNTWNPKLASQSEENVHADREGKRDFKEMQREAKERAENEYRTGASEESGPDSKS